MLFKKTGLLNVEFTEENVVILLWVICKLNYTKAAKYSSFGGLTLNTCYFYQKIICPSNKRKHYWNISHIQTQTHKLTRIKKVGSLGFF